MNKELLFCWVAMVLGSCAADTGFDGDPQRFIARARGHDLRLFDNVCIDVRNERDGRFHYYYSHTFVPGDTLTLPAFEYFDQALRSDSTHWADVYRLADRQGLAKGSALQHAKAYAQDLDSLYRALGAMSVCTTPDSSGVITFTLGPRCRVFYLKEPTTPDSRWQGFLRTKVAVAPQWYYDCQ